MKIIEKQFTLYLENEEVGNDVVECTLHWYRLDELPNVPYLSECVGEVSITIGDREPFTFAVWGGDEDTEHNIWVPTMSVDNGEMN